MKRCFKCEVEKDESEFYGHKMMADGRLGKCKECTKADVVANRAKNIDYYRAYDRERGNRQSSEYHQQYRNRFPQKYKAKNAVNNAIRDGKMKRKTSCEDCGSTFAVHAHHDDYAQPLSVRWLCSACHKKWHMENGAGANGA